MKFGWIALITLLLTVGCSNRDQDADNADRGTTGTDTTTGGGGTGTTGGGTTGP